MEGKENRKGRDHRTEGANRGVMDLGGDSEHGQHRYTSENATIGRPLPPLSLLLTGWFVSGGGCCAPPSIWRLI